MNKKIIAIVTSLVVSGGVLMGTAYTNAAQLSGYDAYKLAIKDTSSLKNETADLKVSVNDAGKNLVDVNSNIKVNSATNAMSQATTVKSSKGSENFSTFNQTGKSISKSSTSKVYNVRENNHKSFNKENKVMNPEVSKSIQTVVDTLVGSMKNNVNVISQTNGTKKVAINLNQNEIVPLVNAVTSIAIVKSNNEPRLNEKVGNLDIKNMLPQLESDINVKSVVVTGDINKDNIITNQIAKIVVTGKDAKGITHEVTINASLNLSNINKTTPNTVNLTGKQVKTITGGFRGRN
jgi:hypothetical protein